MTSNNGSGFGTTSRAHEIALQGREITNGTGKRNYIVLLHSYIKFFVNIFEKHIPLWLRYSQLTDRGTEAKKGCNNFNLGGNETLNHYWILNVEIYYRLQH